MPWCDPCSVYKDATVIDDGKCPDCGEHVSEEQLQENDEQPATVGQSAPWHFWIVVVALIGYIGWRVIDLIMSIF